MANLPNGKRVIVQPTIGGKKRTVRMKQSTAQFLGLEPVTSLIEGKKNSIKRGAKGTKSFTLLLKQKVKVGGASVKTLAYPVPGEVTLKMFYSYARKLPNVIGIVSPQGISYAWGKYQSGLGALIPDLPSLPNPFDGGIGLDDVGDLVDFVGDLVTGQGLIGSGLELIGDVVD